ncbi:hypothetical protein AgCh_032305 [Apium graveolens]
MDQSSSSSIRTAFGRDPGKRPLEEGDQESFWNLNNLEIPDLEQCGSFDFMNEDELLKGIPTGPLPSPPLSPRTLERRRRIVEDSLRAVRYHDGQVYFDCPYKRVKIVSVRSSNSVDGASLGKILNSGVKGEMDKAMMLLIKRASRKSADGAPSGPSRVGHSVSIELLDDQGNKVVEDPGKAMPDVEPADLNSRKRGRREVEEENCGDGGLGEADASVGGVNTCLTLVGNRATMASTIDPRSKKRVVRVEIQPHERWTGGITVLLRVFDLFHLPQDAIAFDGRRREDLADRCKSRAGRFLADFMHVVEEFRAGESDAARAKLEAEVSTLRAEKKKLEMNYSGLEKRSFELANANTALSKKVSEMDVKGQSMDAQVSEVEHKLRDAKQKRDSLRVKCEAFERQVDGMNSSYKLIVDENTALKAEVEKGIEDIVNALGDGYGRCVTRMQGAGFDVTGHTFEDYISDLAASHPDDPTDTN